MKLAIIILNWNNYDFTLSCVASFKKAIRKDYEAVIVDNHSDNDSTRKIQAEFPEYTYIYSPVNAGIAKGNNLGIKYALGKDARFIFLGNNDIEILDSETFDKMIAYMEENPKIGILGVKLILPDGCVQNSVKNLPTIWNQFYFEGLFFNRLPRSFDKEKIIDAPFVMGAAFLIRREMIEDIGLEDEQFFCGHEDIDWCKRAWDAGWKVCYFPEVSIKHIGGGSSQHLYKLNFDFYFSEKLKYFKKHYSFFHVLFFRFFTSVGSLPRAISGWMKWFLKRKDANKAYARAYTRLIYRIWVFPWKKYTVNHKYGL